MKINTNQTISEASLCPEKNAKKDPCGEMTEDEKIDFIAARILKEYRRAFEELAK